MLLPLSSSDTLVQYPEQYTEVVTPQYHVIVARLVRSVSDMFGRGRRLRFTIMTDTSPLKGTLSPNKQQLRCRAWQKRRRQS